MNIDKCFDFMKAYIGQRNSPIAKVMMDSMRENFDQSKNDPMGNAHAILHAMADLRVADRMFPSDQWFVITVGIILAAASDTPEFDKLIETFNYAHAQRDLANKQGDKNGPATKPN